MHDLSLVWPFQVRLIQRCLAAALFLVLSAGVCSAETLGLSFAGSNDSLGDWYDRWQSNSAQVALATGPAWTGRAPATLGELLEWRLRSDILTPSNLTSPLPTDRRHAGVFALGVHTHASRGAFDLRLGGDLFVVGPQTGLLQFQRNLHRILGFPVPTLDDFQIEDAVRAQVSGEISRAWDAGSFQIRPFLEAQAGPEDLVRIGADLSFGGIGRDDLMTRLPVTGHRVPLVRQGNDGVGFVVGGDVAWVRKSLYLPASLGYDLTDMRTRLRAGVHYERERFDVFYGISWLGREFEAQREGQFVGALHLGLRF